MNLFPQNEPLMMTLEGYSSFMMNLAKIEWNTQITKETPSSENAPLTVVPIYGTMLRGISPRMLTLLNYFDVKVADTAQVAAQLRELKNDDAVKVVLLDINSPGGRVTGTPELAAAVQALSKSKPIYAYTGDLACSAAYWVASQCDAVYAAPSAQLGSIGVLLPILDCKERYEKEGLKMDVISAGKFKTAGLVGTSLSDEQRELLQCKVNEDWDRFKAAVNRRRNINAAHMEGQSFMGIDAVEFGLADENVNSLDELKTKLIGRHRLKNLT